MALIHHQSQGWSTLRGREHGPRYTNRDLFFKDVTKRAAHLKYAGMVNDSALEEQMIIELQNMFRNNTKYLDDFIIYSDSPYISLLEEKTSFGYPPESAEYDLAFLPEAGGELMRELQDLFDYCKHYNEEHPDET